MSRIKIEDLPIMEDLSQEQTKGIFGGALMEPTISRDQFSLDSYSSTLMGIRSDTGSALSFDDGAFVRFKF